MFVVTGTPRSATGYASKLFSAMDIPTTHEELFRPRGTFHDVLTAYFSDKESGDSSWLAWAYLPMLPGPLKVLHTVRNPWTVIDSLAHRNDILQPDARLDPGKKRLREMAQWLCPEIFKHDDGINRAAAMVVRWNRKIEHSALISDCPLLRYQAEKMDFEQAKRILEWLGIDRDDIEIRRAFEEVKPDVNRGMGIDHNVEITNPDLKAYLDAACPGVPHVLARVLRVGDDRRSQTELERTMTPELRDAVRDIAEEYGYSNNEESVDACNECQAV